MFTIWSLVLIDHSMLWFHIAQVITYLLHIAAMMTARDEFVKNAIYLLMQINFYLSVGPIQLLIFISLIFLICLLTTIKMKFFLWFIYLLKITLLMLHCFRQSFTLIKIHFTVKNINRFDASVVFGIIL